MFRQPPAARRSPLAALVSLVLHGASIAAAVYIGTQEIFTPRVDRHSSLTFLMFTPPHAPVELPNITLPVEATRPLELPPQAAEITPIVMTTPVVEPPPLPQPPAPPAPKIASAIAQPRQPVKYGTFASTAAAPVTEPKRVLQTAGFDVAAAAAPDLKLKTAQVGAFDSQPA